MVKRWLLYLAALCGCLIFYMAYKQWFAAIAMVAVLSLPWLSLLLSLLGMLRLRMKLESPRWLQVGGQATVEVSCKENTVVLPHNCCLHATNVLTGQQLVLHPGEKIPADHCGKILCKPKKARVYDFLGLFFMRLRGLENQEILIRPQICPVRNLQSLEQHMACAWRPKAGGGFAENHELRLYRPGDSLNQIHWKLSAKTGEYIIREPMIPDGVKTLVTMDLTGRPEELDRKLGRLQWLMGHLLEKNLIHEICVHTAAGVKWYLVASEQDALDAMDSLLSCPAAGEDRVLTLCGKAGWHCHIGGEPDEA